MSVYIYNMNKKTFHAILEMTNGRIKRMEMHWTQAAI